MNDMDRKDIYIAGRDIHEGMFHLRRALLHMADLPPATIRNHLFVCAHACETMMDKSAQIADMSR
ncbi:hypothetical protein PQU92_08190 [Asticcacaulis sp. BYS171W]|uniref:Uncharacterized protein n=1 Tax=Asticcacaulis aquaticus TaxID=2984212 RepID=A0ABT5HT49_9CAUL|nr:hypothetical protein [Asticcacaulis aquaticus]MDC7683253.1 hypothetical protein [Asticcacaulis aquaticus]